MTTTIPVEWYPQRRSTIIGIIYGGFGLSSIFSPLQSLIINPKNLAPTRINITNITATEEVPSTSALYFTDTEVLMNFKNGLLYMSATYTVMLSIGAALMVEKEPSQVEMERVDLIKKISDSFSYVYNLINRGDIHLLFTIRFLFLTVGAGALAHWKTFAFTRFVTEIS